MKSLLNQAIILAAKYHEGQVDKGGEAYILHPLRLMLRASTEEERIVALLHDIVEDTFLTIGDVRMYGFSEEIVQAVDCLTRREGEEYLDFIRRICENPLARQVKILDISDNMDLTRIPEPTEKDLSRQRRYVKAMAILKGESS